MNDADCRQYYRCNAKTPKAGEGDCGKSCRVTAALHNRLILLNIAAVPADDKVSSQREIGSSRHLSTPLNTVQYRNGWRLKDGYGGEKPTLVWTASASVV